ncbi:MAG: lysylphosphatidylglycerol synthase transmembrane domain-containing protein [Planctomycetota bacterium]
MNPQTKKHLFTALRVVVIAAGVGYILSIVDWADDPAAGTEGVFTLLRRADGGWLLGGLAVIGLVFPLQAVRWYGLLRCRGLAVSLRSVFRLTMVGQFFNFCVPVGSTGGDVVRAYGAAKGVTTPGGPTAAVVSVLIDRVAGLLGLVVLAAAAGPLVWGDPTGRRVTLIAWALLGSGVAGGAVYLWPVTRRWLGVERATRLAAVRRVDEAVTAYRRHGWTVAGAVALSVPVHLSICLATAFAGYAIGVDEPVVSLVAALPIVFLVGALPVSFMGLGIMEAAARGVFGGGVLENEVVLMLMAYRLYMLGYALLGGVLMLGRGARLRERDAGPGGEEPATVWAATPTPGAEAGVPGAGAEVPGAGGDPVP